MPQLNPSPWLSTMLITWMVFLLFMQPKLLPFTPINHPPNPKTKYPNKPSPWPWPWT